MSGGNDITRVAKVCLLELRLGYAKSRISHDGLPFGRNHMARFWSMKSSNIHVLLTEVLKPVRKCLTTPAQEHGHNDEFTQDEGKLHRI